MTRTCNLSFVVGCNKDDLPTISSIIFYKQLGGTTKPAAVPTAFLQDACG